MKQIIVSLFILIGLTFGVVSKLPDDKLHLIFCDVGQGDALLIIRGQTQILVDGGPNDKVLSCLGNHLPFWDKDLEMVILTHPEADHLNGIISVIDRYSVRQIIGNSLVSSSGTFSKFREEVIREKIPVYSPKYGDKIKIGKLTFQILWPREKLGDELVWQSKADSQVLGAYAGSFNETSVVSLLEYGQFQTLLTGDIGFKEEQSFLADLGGADVLKVGHHGSKYSTSKDLLEKLKPALAVISVGLKNNYGHPSKEVLERLKEAGAKVWRTDLDGEVEVVSDGERWEVR